MRRLDLFFLVVVLLGLIGINAIEDMLQGINKLYINLGGVFWVLILAMIYLIVNWNKK